jgi:hypothetical protein
LLAQDGHELFPDDTVAPALALFLFFIVREILALFVLLSAR